MQNDFRVRRAGQARHPLRLWLKAAGIWHRRRQRKQYRSRRARFGELVQLDGSIHAWFTGNGEKQCLMNMVDDATGTTEAFLDTGETTFAALTLLERWIKKYGIPVYTGTSLEPSETIGPLS